MAEFEEIILSKGSLNNTFEKCQESSQISFSASKKILLEDATQLLTDTDDGSSLPNLNDNSDSVNCLEADESLFPVLCKRSSLKNRKRDSNSYSEVNISKSSGSLESPFVVPEKIINKRNCFKKSAIKKGKVSFPLDITLDKSKLDSNSFEEPEPINKGTCPFRVANNRKLLSNFSLKENLELSTTVTNEIIENAQINSNDQTILDTPKYFKNKYENINPFKRSNLVRHSLSQSLEDSTPESSSADTDNSIKISFNDNNSMQKVEAIVQNIDALEQEPMDIESIYLVRENNQEKLSSNEARDNTTFSEYQEQCSKNEGNAVSEIERIQCERSVRENTQEKLSSNEARDNTTLSEHQEQCSKNEGNAVSEIERIQCERSVRENNQEKLSSNEARDNTTLSEHQEQCSKNEGNAVSEIGSIDCEHLVTETLPAIESNIENLNSDQARDNTVAFSEDQEQRRKSEVNAIPEIVQVINENTEKNWKIIEEKCENHLEISTEAVADNVEIESINLNSGDITGTILPQESVLEPEEPKENDSAATSMDMDSFLPPVEYNKNINPFKNKKAIEFLKKKSLCKTLEFFSASKDIDESTETLKDKEFNSTQFADETIKFKKNYPFKKMNVGKHCLRDDITLTKSRDDAEISNALDTEDVTNRTFTIAVDNMIAESNNNEVNNPLLNNIVSSVSRGECSERLNESTNDKEIYTFKDTNLVAGTCTDDKDTYHEQDKDSIERIVSKEGDLINDTDQKERQSKIKEIDSSKINAPPENQGNITSNQEEFTEATEIIINNKVNPFKNLRKIQPFLGEHQGKSDSFSFSSFSENKVQTASNSKIIVTDKDREYSNNDSFNATLSIKDNPFKRARKSKYSIDLKLQLSDISSSASMEDSSTIKNKEKVETNNVKIMFEEHADKIVGTEHSEEREMHGIIQSLDIAGIESQKTSDKEIIESEETFLHSHSDSVKVSQNTEIPDCGAPNKDTPDLRMENKVEYLEKTNVVPETKAVEISNRLIKSLDNSGINLSEANGEIIDQEKSIQNIADSLSCDESSLNDVSENNSSLDNNSSKTDNGIGIDDVLMAISAVDPSCPKELTHDLTCNLLAKGKDGSPNKCNLAAILSDIEPATISFTVDSQIQEMFENESTNEAIGTSCSAESKKETENDKSSFENRESQSLGEELDGNNVAINHSKVEPKENSNVNKPSTLYKDESNKKQEPFINEDVESKETLMPDENEVHLNNKSNELVCKNSELQKQLGEDFSIAFKDIAVAIVNINKTDCVNSSLNNSEKYEQLERRTLLVEEKSKNKEKFPDLVENISASTEDKKKITANNSLASNVRIESTSELQKNENEVSCAVEDCEVNYSKASPEKCEQQAVTHTTFENRKERSCSRLPNKILSNNKEDHSSPKDEVTANNSLASNVRIESTSELQKNENEISCAVEDCEVNDSKASPEKCEQQAVTHTTFENRKERRRSCRLQTPNKILSGSKEENSPKNVLSLTTLENKKDFDEIVCDQTSNLIKQSNLESMSTSKPPKAATPKSREINAEIDSLSGKVIETNSSRSNNEIKGLETRYVKKKTQINKSLTEPEDKNSNSNKKSPDVQSKKQKGTPSSGKSNNKSLFAEKVHAGANEEVNIGEISPPKVTTRLSSKTVEKTSLKSIDFHKDQHLPDQIVAKKNSLTSNADKLVTNKTLPSVSIIKRKSKEVGDVNTSSKKTSDEIKKKHRKSERNDTKSETKKYESTATKEQVYHVNNKEQSPSENKENDVGQVKIKRKSQDNFAELSTSFDVSAIPSNKSARGKKFRYKSTPLVVRALRRSSRVNSVITSTDKPTSSKAKISSENQPEIMNDSGFETKKSNKNTDSQNGCLFPVPNAAPKKSSIPSSYKSRRSVTFRPHSSLISPPAPQNLTGDTRNSNSVKRKRSEADDAKGKSKKVTPNTPPSKSSSPSNNYYLTPENKISYETSLDVSVIVHATPKIKKSSIFHSTPKNRFSLQKSNNLKSLQNTENPMSLPTDTLYTTSESDAGPSGISYSVSVSKRTRRRVSLKSASPSSLQDPESYDSHTCMATKIGTTTMKHSGIRTSLHNKIEEINNKHSTDSSEEATSCFNRPPGSFSSQAYSEDNSLAHGVQTRQSLKRSSIIIEERATESRLGDGTMQMSLRSSRILHQSSTTAYPDSLVDETSQSTVVQSTADPEKSVTLISKFSKKRKQEDSIFKEPKKIISKKKQDPLPKLAKPAKWVRKELFTFLQKKLDKEYPLEKRYISERIVIILCNAVESTLFGHPDLSLPILKAELNKYNICTTQLDYFSFLIDHTPREFIKQVVPMGRAFGNVNYSYKPIKCSDPIV